MDKIIIFAAPSGSGKTTIVGQLLKDCPQLAFSISATTRLPRGKEEHGRDYYFISVSEFEAQIREDAFLEWEMVYEGKYYGTLKSEIERITRTGKVPVLDIDVVGAVRLKKQYPEHVYALFIKAPSKEVLAQRLRGRGTDSEEVIQERLEKAQYEMGFEPHFDRTVINDDVETAVQDAKKILNELFPANRLFLL